MLQDMNVETYIHTHTHTHTHTQHIPMDPYQFAYRSNRSIQDAVMCLTTTVTNFIHKAQTNYTRCLFLDFSSAFNTIRVEYLIPLLQHLDSNITQWIISFLSNHGQQTISNNNLSDMIITNTGTPQGPVLSSLLFSLYTDGNRSSFQNFLLPVVFN